jgi:hypothetical protein
VVSDSIRLDIVSTAHTQASTRPMAMAFTLMATMAVDITVEVVGVGR